MKEKQRGDLYSGIIFLLFGIFLYVGSYWIPATTSDILGSRFFPQVVAVAIVFLAAIQIFMAVKAGRDEAVKEEVQEKKEGSGFSKPLMYTVAALIAYYVLVINIGFTITSILYLFVQSMILMPAEDIKQPKKMVIPVLVSIIVPIVLNLIFWRVFSIQLPEGKLF